jgi:hypothetical protein
MVVTPDIRWLLDARPSRDLVAAIARVALAQRDPRVACPTYLRALGTALDDEPPPFGTQAYADAYRTASSDGQWLAISLMTNAEREGDGAKRLWSLAACARSEEERQLLKGHAIDESRHAQIYLALLDLTFPGAVNAAFRGELAQLSPGYARSQQPVAVDGSPYARAPSIDDYVQMNIAEIRTTIHHIMQRSAISAHCPPDNLARGIRMQSSLLHDELRHVSYTALLIDRKAGHTAEFATLFRKRMRDFNQITNDELRQARFDG